MRPAAPWRSGATRRARHAAAGAVLVASCLLLSSCKTPSFLCVKPSGLRALTVLTTASTNDGLAPRIDVVFVTDKAALKLVEKLKAREYFAQKEQLVRDFPKGIRIQEFGLEPTQYIAPSRAKAAGKDVSKAQLIDPPCNLAGSMLFVDYNNDAPNRVKLTKAKAGTLVLGPDDFTWQRR